MEPHEFGRADPIDPIDPPVRSSPSRSPIKLGLLLIVLVAVTLWAFSENTSPYRTPEGAIGADGRARPGDVYNPVTAGEPLPEGFRQLLPRDAIRPVYDPTFTTADDIGWSDDTDVIGVEIDGAAKAYPVAFLNGRELVVDELAGWPILVSW